MSKKLTTEEFIKRAKEIHGGKYDYSLTDYKGFDFSKMKRAETEKFHSLQENDRLKRNFCKERNIKKLEIMFSEYENIESILDEALNDSSRVV